VEQQVQLQQEQQQHERQQSLQFSIEHEKQQQQQHGQGGPNSHPECRRKPPSCLYPEFSPQRHYVMRRLHSRSSEVFRMVRQQKQRLA